MSKDFILVEDGLFSNNDCEKLIAEYSYKTKKAERTELDYLYCTIDIDSFSHLEKIVKVLKDYKDKFDEIDKTPSMWKLDSLRFKHFKPGHSYNQWHSEHSLTYPNRVLSLQIYLSEHNCGTEFYNGEVIKSKIGRVALFPAYFTHTHRGQVCPENKDRYIITGYFSFNKKGQNE